MSMPPTVPRFKSLPSVAALAVAGLGLFSWDVQAGSGPSRVVARDVRSASQEGRGTAEHGRQSGAEASKGDAPDFEALFRNPPPSASPWVFWYWMQGNVSTEGITADLEAMKAVGVGGAYLMPIQGPQDPPLMNPPVVQLSDAFWDAVRHAMQEADRLGLKIGMHACDGFAVAGGPWITPELSMQRVVWSETAVEGGQRFHGELPMPESNEDYYRDIAVVAFPALEGAGLSTRTAPPAVSTSVLNGDASGLPVPGNTQGFRSEEPCWVQYAFEAPFTCRSLVIRPDGNNFQSKRLTLQASDDGEVFRTVQPLEPPRHGWQDADFPLTYAIPPTTARYFRFVFDAAGSEPGSEDLDSAKWKPVLKIDGIELFGEPKIHQYEGKSAQVWRVAGRTSSDDVPDEVCIPLTQMVDVTDRMSPQGELTWDVPPGAWTILRMGHTSTGHRNATGGGGIGLECDKFNPEAVRLQFDRWFGEAIRRAGPELASRVLKVFHVDSWECGSQNWSPVFRQEFLRRRGYDPVTYLPAMAGFPVESAAASEKFLHDMRETIGELVVDNFYGTLRELAHDVGCEFSGECTSPIMATDGLRHFGALDVPMGEFWLRSPTHDKPNDMLDAISGAHVYGKPIIQAEAFTQLRIAWDEHPGMLKAIGDRNYALGINRFVYHVYTHNPWLDRRPGMTLNGVGLYYQRDQTWWAQSRAWVDYARRCQALLQQGRPVVDVAVLTGEDVPRRAVLPDRLISTLPGLFGPDVVERDRLRRANEGLPRREEPEGVGHSANMADPEDWVDPLRGYAYDSINPDALLRLAEVRDGRIELPGGASYGVLVLAGARLMDPAGNTLSPALTDRLRTLLQSGATLILSKDIDATTSLAGNPGRGRVVTAPYREETLAALGLERDLWVTQPDGAYAADVAWTHRRTDDADIYFISNQREEERELAASFRISGRVPALMDPVTGSIQTAGQWERIGEGTQLRLRLPPQGSLFVVFCERTAERSRAVGLNWNEPDVVRQISAPWRVEFDAPGGGDDREIQFDELTDWAQHPESEVRHFSGAASYHTTFSWNPAGHEGSKLWLDLGHVGSLASVKLNGADCGIVWTAPFRVDVTGQLRSGENELSVEVVNPWHNRLVQEAGLPESDRTLWMNAPNRLRDKPLLSAGLLGPVRLVAVASGGD